MKAPFQPTTCRCPADKGNCTRQPGHLLPGQMEEILATLGASITDAARYFWNSPGMVIRTIEGLRRIRTITPRFENGRCVFFTEDGLCGIHEVAPFGCRYFDVHMTAIKAQKRSKWGAQQILKQLWSYDAQRDDLPEATHYEPKSF